MIFDLEDREKLEKVSDGIKQKLPNLHTTLLEIFEKKYNSEVGALVLQCKDTDTFRYVQGKAQVFRELMNIFKK